MEAIEGFTQAANLGKGKWKEADYPAYFRQYMSRAVSSQIRDTDLPPTSEKEAGARIRELGDLSCTTGSGITVSSMEIGASFKLEIENNKFRTYPRGFEVKTVQHDPYANNQALKDLLFKRILFTYSGIPETNHNRFHYEFNSIEQADLVVASDACVYDRDMGVLLRYSWSETLEGIWLPSFCRVVEKLGSLASGPEITITN